MVNLKSLLSLCCLGCVASWQGANNRMHRRWKQRNPRLMPLRSSEIQESSIPSPMSNRDDHLVSVVSSNGEVVVKAITARNLVQDALIKQDLNPLATKALGRLMVCTLLCASGLKDEETLQFTMEGDGPLGKVMSISDGTGGVRGYVQNGLGEVIGSGGAMDVGRGIGRGLMKVVRNHPDYERPYSGIVALRTSQVAFDVAGYLKESEQRSCAIAAGVTVNGALVRQAGGYIVETLPDASDETIRIVAENLGKLMGTSEDPSQLLATNLTPTALAESLVEGLGGVDSITITKPVYKCHCSSERVFRALRLLGREEVKRIREENEVIEVKCEFCGQIYRLDGQQIEQELGVEFK